MPKSVYILSFPMNTLTSSISCEYIPGRKVRVFLLFFLALPQALTEEYCNEWQYVRDDCPFGCNQSFLSHYNEGLLVL